MNPSSTDPQEKAESTLGHEPEDWRRPERRGRTAGEEAARRPRVRAGEEGTLPPR